MYDSSIDQIGFQSIFCYTSHKGRYKSTFYIHIFTDPTRFSFINITNDT